MTISTRRAATLAAICLGLSAALSAQAKPQPVNQHDCSIDDFENAIACSGRWTPGNDQLHDPLTVNNLDIFGGEWDFLSKIETPGGNEGIDIGLTALPHGGALDGTWAVNADSLTVFDEVLFVVKAGNGFSAYLVTDTTLTSGNWDVSRWGHGISHLSVYSRGTNPNNVVTSVPEPATSLLFGAGLLGLAASARRRR